jgi:ATP-binding cassette subfamily C (CFTR/MRP) protein 1
VSALAIVVLIAVEHNRTVRPATLTSIYLLSSLVADFVLLRTLYLRDYVPNIAAVLATTASCRLVLFLLESWPKTSYLKLTDRPFGPVEVAGPISKAFLWWLNPILLLGNRQILDLSNMYPLDQDLYSDGLRERMAQSWEKCSYVRHH